MQRVFLHVFRLGLGSQTTPFSSTSTMESQPWICCRWPLQFSGTRDSRQHVFHDVLPNLECGTDFFHRPSQEYHLLWSPGFAWRTGATATMAWHKPQESPSLVKPSEDRFVCCHSWALCFPPLKDMGASHVLQVIIDPMVATLNTSHIAMFLSLQSRLPGWWLRQLRMVYTSHS